MLGTVGKSALLLMCLASSSFAQEYDSGASDSEIKLGQTQPYGGPVSAAATTGFASTAYFEAINKKGGINGRKVTLISLDDGYSPPKTVELTRKLVEGDEVFAIYGSVGTPTNAAVQKYLNGKKVPQLFITTGASRFADPTAFRWTIPMLPGYAAEARATARYVLSSVPDPKIAILYQNDDLGKDFVSGFKSGLGESAKRLIVSEQSFEVTSPTIDSQLVTAKASGANVFYFAGTQKFGAMQIRVRHEIGWKPLNLVCSIASGVETVLKPAGLDRAEGIISTGYVKDPSDPRWQNDDDMKEYNAWMRDNLPGKNPSDAGYIAGYQASYLMAHVLRQAGSKLTRDNLLDIATRLKDMKVPLLLPGITATTTPDDYSTINRFWIQRFESGRWTPIGDGVQGG